MGSIHQYIADELAESAAVKNAIRLHLCDSIADAAARLISCLERGGKILACGNGGSAADAQHLAGELVGRFRAPRRGLPALALTTDSSVLTAIANDFDFNQ